MQQVGRNDVRNWPPIQKLL